MRGCKHFASCVFTFMIGMRLSKGSRELFASNHQTDCDISLVQHEQDLMIQLG